MAEGTEQITSDGDAIRAAMEGDTSWIQQVRAERDEAVKDEALKMGVPTWGTVEAPTLVIEYGIVERELLVKFQTEARKKQRKGEPGAGTEIDIRFLATACRAVYLRNPETNKLVKLEKNGDPIRIDRRLGELLGLDPESDGKNSVTLFMYLVKHNEVALGSHALSVARWMANTSREVEDQVLGE